MSIEKQKKCETDSDIQFLEKCGASSSIKDLLLELAQVQPNDSISYVVDYFNSMREKADCIQKAERYLKQLANDRSYFLQKISLSFDCLASNNFEQKYSLKSQDRKFKCITGKLLIEFLNSFTNKLLPPAICDFIQKKLNVKIYEPISVNRFMFILCLLYYIRDITNISDVICNNNVMKDSNGEINNSVCCAVLKQLKDALKKSSSLDGLIEGLHLLSPEHLQTVIVKARTRNAMDSIDNVEFLKSICDLFFEKMETCG